MKKSVTIFTLSFLILSLSSCGSRTKKYTVGDTWTIELPDEYSLECHFVEMRSRQISLTLNKVNEEDNYNFAIKSNISTDGSGLYISNLYASDVRIEVETTGIIPTSYFRINPFNKSNKIKIFFSKDIDAFKKIDIKGTDFFMGVPDLHLIGIRIYLYPD